MEIIDMEWPLDIVKKTKQNFKNNHMEWLIPHIWKKKISHICYLQNKQDSMMTESMSSKSDFLRYKFGLLLWINLTFLGLPLFYNIPQMVVLRIK